ncbi:cation transporter [Methanocella sp. CWC-04]|uniref:Cation transporter n=1 Tax=Methanooceanicella nereidis TaxID=2052831 RepID=A0AAP2RB36_9EURY|nr:cation diffusion facilitator family transporter [Methanocella sp. CWC-04]MCD1294068.1 cation transporter [Methanocella sp. CWC-04]
MRRETPEKSGIDKTPESVLIRVAFLSLIVNVGLVIAKLGLSLISGSLALRADGIHSFVDVIMSVALIFGIKISSRKSKGYPYGLYKVENIVSVAISLLIFLTAYEITLEALSSKGAQLPYSGWVLVAVALIVPVPYILGMYEVKVGRKYNSPSLIADGEQHKVDVLTASIVFFALLGQYFGIPLDSIAAIIVALFIIRSGWYILKDSMRTLLDASIDHDTLDTIRAAILSDPIVRRVKRITGRNSGRFMFVEATVTMAGSDLEKAHNASERIEDQIRKLVPNVDRVLIHYEPETKTHLRYAIPLQDREGKLSPHFGEAPFFALIDFNVKECKFERQKIIANQEKESEKRKGIMVAKMLLDNEPDVVLTKQSLSGKSASYVFGAANIKVKETDAESISRAIEQIERELRWKNTIEE